MWGAKVRQREIDFSYHINHVNPTMNNEQHITIQVKLRNDMPDDMLRDAIETSRRVLNSVSDFETQGTHSNGSLNAVNKCHNV